MDVLGVFGVLSEDVLMLLGRWFDEPYAWLERLDATETHAWIAAQLLLPLRDSGHGGGTTLTALVEQDVDELSFYCWALDVAPIE